MDQQIFESLAIQLNQSKLSFFSSNRLDILFQSQVNDFDQLKNTILVKNTVALEYLSPFLSGDEFHLTLGSLQLISNTIKSDGENMIFTISEILESNDNRDEKREYYDDPENCYCKLTNPHDSKTTLIKPIIDFSASGCSFQTHAQSKAFDAGIEIESLSIFINKQTYLSKNAIVVYNRIIHKIDHKPHLQVGVKFSN